MNMNTASVVEEKDVERLVNAFYARVPADPLIGPVFMQQVEDWPAHLTLLKSFWMTVLGLAGSENGLLPRVFAGNPMQTHLKLDLEPEHFARWLALFAETAREVLDREKAEIFIARSERIAQTLQRGIAAQRQ
ncbi:MAG TPA: group III truncated hemoglobin [Acidobacteriaceae bacterium]|nr:group III truncated hemoglobin [Acidobacteriaceae bacterium]